MSDMERASAGEWYRLRDMGDGVTLIEEPHIKPFYRGNMWHVRGRDRDMLVDTGMGLVSLSAEVPLLSERPLLAVASHTHFDHIGCHGEFAKRLVHPAEAGILANPTRATTLVDSYVSWDMFTRLPPDPFSPEEYAVDAAPATEMIVDGDIIDLGDREFQVIHAPGHSPGSIGLFEAERGIFISGDIVYDGPLVDDTYHSDIDDYIVSMRRILDLPVTVVHGGHFGSCGPERCRAIIETWLAEKTAE
jgi:glyoxylase-like metal-dependent hydrolase (beta-lactamase superfamily II)